MTNKFNTRLNALKALLFWSIRLLAIHFLLLWIKFTDKLEMLKDHVFAIASRFLTTIKSKLPNASLVAIKTLLVWMKFTDMLRRLKTSLLSIFLRLLARLKRISLRSFFKSLLSRYLLYLVLINAVPLLALAWIYFGTLIVPASVHSTHSSSWWIIFQWVVIVLSIVHGVFSIVLLRMRKITQGYILSLLITCSPFLYAYIGYARQVNGLSVSGTLNAFIPFLIAYSKIILGMIILK
jgi:hypothetical protein